MTAFPFRTGRLVCHSLAGMTCWLCFFVSDASAFALPQPATRLSARVWRTENGLPSNSISAIRQTRDGYLWLGTPGGLVRFDGVRAEVFNQARIPSLGDNRILSLAELPDGSLLIGSDGGGVLRYHEGHLNVWPAPQGIEHAYVRAVFANADGTALMGTGGAGLSVVKQQQVKQYLFRDNIVRAVWMDRWGNYWAGSGGGGLARINSSQGHEQTTYFGRPQGLPSDYIWSLYEDRQGRLWVGTERGLCMFDGTSFKTYTTRDGLSADSIRALLEDRDGNLWIGTTGGLNRFSAGKFTAFTTRDGLPDNLVLSLCEDREGSLWVGTQDGLVQLRNVIGSTLSVSDGLSAGPVNYIARTASGNMWFATDEGGIDLLRDGKVTSIGVWPGRGAIYEDRQGRLWIAVEKSLVLYDKGKVTTYTDFSGQRFAGVTAFAEDDQGLLMTLTETGNRRVLCRFQQNRIVPLPDEQQPPKGYYTFSIYAPRHGEYWFSTLGGLMHSRDGQFTLYTTAHGLRDNVVHSVHQDRAGIIWAATRRGLARLENGRFVCVGLPEGLLDELIWQVFEDQQEYLWLASNRGVLRVSKQELNELAAGKRRTIHCQAFGTTDGLRSAECIGLTQMDEQTRYDGQVWIGTARGAALIETGELKTNQQIPPVFIEKLLADGENIGTQDALCIPAGHEKFEIHFAGLSFVAPERMRFRYKLEGFDADWVDVGARRIAYFTNIPPGQYRFRVRAANSDGVWNESGATLNFYLEPRLYQTYWFYSVCAALIGLTIFGAHRLHVRQVHQRFAAVLSERNRIARELHDTLEQSLSMILLQVESGKEKLANAPQAANKHLEWAASIIQHSMVEARRSVFDLRDQWLERDNLAGVLGELTAPLAASSPVQVELKVNGTPRTLPGMLEHNLLRIAQEALTNALKHAHASHISIELSYEVDRVTLRVVDDGCGFEPQNINSSLGGHYGLLGMRERAEKIGAKLSLNSQPGAGAEIEIIASGV